MIFLDVAECFEKIEQESSRLAMTQLLAGMLHKATAKEAAYICYLSLGQLNPSYIGTQFGIAQEMMIKVLAQYGGETEAWVKSRVKKVGDLGLVVQEIGEASQRYHDNKMKLTQVYDALAAIEKLQGTGSQEEKIEQMTDLILQVDPLAAKYIVRIVIGKLRLGFSDMTIIDALSWVAVGNKSLRGTFEEAYNLCADIGYIARLFKEKGLEGLKNVSVVVGIPIRPSSAERLPSAQAIVDKLGPCVAQPKLDGFRVQVHLSKKGKKPEVYFFSRNLKDMSAMFPDLVDAIIALEVEDIVCEGEAIVYDRNTGSFLPFQETVKRKRKHDIEQVMEELPLHLYLFDILYMNGETLLSLSHEQRRNKLLTIVGKQPKDSVVRVIEEKKITTGKELEDYFLANIEIGLEGLVVKRPDAPYKAGKRNFNWIKLKRQEGGHLEDTVDCVVLGYYAGKGKRAQFGIGAFLVGVYNKKEDRFETVAKVGTGLKDNDWIALKKRCDEYAVTDQPKNVVCSKELVPDVWVLPQIVVVIRADEITQSPLHAAGKTKTSLGYALRFPRFIDYRYDKGICDITTNHEIQRLYEDQVF